MRTYLVGGAVRDMLLGKEPHDKDYVVVESSVDEMLSLGYQQVGKDFPVFLHPITGEEYALARTERKTGNKHTDFEFFADYAVTLFEDLGRRDFTMNAIAFNIENESCWSCCLNDPFKGVNDIRNKIIRHISDSFKEDPLRVLRACRFSAQLGFEIASETMELMSNMVNDGMLNHLTVERVWKETEKALSSGYDSEKYFETLNQCGALKVLFPEIYRLVNTPEQVKYHPSGNTFKHTMIALSRVKNENSLTKFAVVCHDLGKGTTPVDILPKHSGHDERGLTEIDSLCDRLKVPNNYRNCAKTFCKNHMRMARFNEMNVKKQYDMIKELSNNFKEEMLLELYIDCFYADWTGENEQTVWNNLDEADAIYLKMRKIFSLMEKITLKDLPEKTQEDLSKQKGEKFGKLYRDAMISYLKYKLKNS